MRAPTPAPSILILGGRSEIGLAIARRFAKEGAGVALAARAIEEMAELADGFRGIAGSPATLHRFDILDVDGHRTFLDAFDELPEIVVCAVGLDTPQVRLTTGDARLMMETNYVAPVLLLEEIARRMEARDRGTIIGLSSVAGDRGRAGNYIYGSAKAGFTAFLSGLRARLSRGNVRVITVKPGFVATRMTAAKRLPRLLTAAPDDVAEAVWNAHQRGRSVIYVLPVWRFVMSAIRFLPESAFQRLRV